MVKDGFKDPQGGVEKMLSPVVVYTCFAVAGALTLMVFGLKFAVTGFGVYGDGLGYYTPLRSLLFDGNLRVDNEYRYYAEATAQFGAGARVFGEIPEYSKYTLGLGIILLPFFVLGHIVGQLLNAWGGEVVLNGMTWPYEFFYCLGSVTLGVGSLVLSYALARRYCSRLASLLAVIGIWFASPLSFYLLVEVSMSHAVSAFLIAAFLWVTFTRPWERRWVWQLWLGILIAMATWVRPQDGLFLVIPPLWSGLQHFGPSGLRSPTRVPISQLALVRAVAVMGLVALGGQIPQILIYISQYGGIDQVPYLAEGQAQGYGSSFRWGQPALWQVLWSGHRGLFIWHPLLLLSVAGLILLFRQHKALALALLVGFLLQVYFVASWWCWWQGASVGGRMFANCTAIFILGLAWFWDWLGTVLGRWRVALGLTIFLIIWNALIILQYQSALIPPEASITWGQLYGNQLRVLPFFWSHLQERFWGGE
jgi:hypothetical protein